MAPAAYASRLVSPPPLQGSLPAGWLAFTGRESNPLDRYKRFQIAVSSSFSGFILAQEKLHVELIVLHGHHGLRHSGSSELKRRAISVTTGLAVISLGSVRASHTGRGLLGLDASAKTLPGKGIGGSAQQPPPTGNARVANGRTPERAGNDSLIAPPVTRVVLPCSVNERLRTDWAIERLALELPSTAAARRSCCKISMAPK